LRRQPAGAVFRGRYPLGMRPEAANDGVSLAGTGIGYQ